MDAIPLAHAGHWLYSLIYVVPIFAVLGALVWDRLTRRKSSRRSSERDSARSENDPH